MESTIEEIRKYAGDVKEYDAEYWNMDVACELKDYPGIGFELSKEDDYYRKKKSLVKMVIVFRNEMEIIHGKVEPGVGIGDFKINMSKEELLEKIGPIYKIYEGKKLETGNATFWLDDNDNVCRIAVAKVYGGKFLGHLGMGSTLMDVKKYAGEFYKNGVTYELKEYPGICFGIGEEGYDYNYDEMKAPINEIIVFQKEKNYKTGIK